MWEKRESLTANDNDLISASLKNHSRSFLWKGAGERSEAGLASANVGVPFHAACIVIGIYAAKPTPSLLYPLPLKPAPTISSSKGV